MKAILTGSISGGFEIDRILTDDVEAEDYVVALLADGKLAEAVPVQSPSSLDHRVKDDGEGRFFINFWAGVGSGMSLYGPFVDMNEAEEFGENNRDEDEEWLLFEGSLVVQQEQGAVGSLAANAVSHGGGELAWSAICNEQGWDESSQIVHLEGFIRDKGLFGEFAGYAEAAAAEENEMAGTL